MKHLNNKAMTLLEVIVAVAILSIASVGIYQSTMLLIKMYGDGKIIYKSNSQIANNIERDLGDVIDGTVTFTVGSDTVTVNGKYYSRSDSQIGETLALFKPN